MENNIDNIEKIKQKDNPTAWHRAYRSTDKGRENVRAAAKKYRDKKKAEKLNAMASTPAPDSAPASPETSPQLQDDKPERLVL